MELGPPRRRNEESDDRLVILAEEGDAAAFEAIVARYAPELQSHARKLAPEGQAEDLVQLVFASAFSAFRSGGHVRHLRGWLHQILRNAVTRHHRARPEVPLDDAAVWTESLEEVIERRLAVHATLSELSALPERQRDALVRTALLGSSRAEIADALDVTEGAVRQLVHRARTTLRRAVAGALPLPVARLFRLVEAGSTRVADGGGAGLGVGSASLLTAKAASVLVATVLVAGVGGPRSAGTRHPGSVAANGRGSVSGAARRGGSVLPSSIALSAASHSRMLPLLPISAGHQAAGNASRVRSPAPRVTGRVRLKASAGRGEHRSPRAGQGPSVDSPDGPETAPPPPGDQLPPRVAAGRPLGGESEPGSAPHDPADAEPAASSPGTSAAATETDEPLATKTDEPLATRPDEPLATNTDEPLATGTDEAGSSPLGKSTSDGGGHGSGGDRTTSTRSAQLSEPEPPTSSPSDSPSTGGSGGTRDSSGSDDSSSS